MTTTLTAQQAAFIAAVRHLEQHADINWIDGRLQITCITVTQRSTYDKLLAASAALSGNDLETEHAHILVAAK